ncbi:anaerobic ribonucleoside-triphosphate reductase activating protein [Orrella sp. 11846]|uniref:anaerobic ribonucleoside-triphosphate reductase activating protein n=1 Tax=Orrella sp. 11846 TaxID=3409913 RepID=UPI003B5C191D
MSASSLLNQRTELTREPSIGGLVKFSTVDWPDQLCATLFLSGCPWRCSYCHNPHLHARQPGYDWADIEAFLQSRIGLLDGVVLSGGEPLMDPGIDTLVQRIADMGFQIGLHTAGIYPERLRAILPSIHWVGLDIKTLPKQYDKLTFRRDSWRPVDQCLEQLNQWSGTWECRTTWSEAWLSQDDLLALGHYLKTRGVSHYAVQRFRHSPDEPPRDILKTSTQEALGNLFESMEVR